MLAVSVESETIGKNVPNSSDIKIDEQEIIKDQDEEVVLVQGLNHTSSSLNSIFSLTLDEIQCKSGRSFGSMNMEEFIANIWSVEEEENATQLGQPQNQTLNNNNNSVTNYDTRHTSMTRQGSISIPIPIPLCKKTVDEIWLELHNGESVGTDSGGSSSGAGNPLRQPTLGEMTLEDFLVKAGVVMESIEKSNDCNDPISSSLTNVPKAAGINCATAFTPYQVYGQGNHSDEIDGDNCYVHNNINNGSMETLVESSGAKGKRRIIDGPPEVVVERRQRRMIKNRESAARSRARKQAYTVELEVELNQLKEENEKLKQVMAEAELKRKSELLMKSKQYSTKAQRLAEKLRRIRRAASLAW